MHCSWTWLCTLQSDWCDTSWFFVRKFAMAFFPRFSLVTVGISFRKSFVESWAQAHTPHFRDDNRTSKSNDLKIIKRNNLIFVAHVLVHEIETLSVCAMLTDVCSMFMSMWPANAIYLQFFSPKYWSLFHVIAIECDTTFLLPFLSLLTNRWWTLKCSFFLYRNVSQ